MPRKAKPDVSAVPPARWPGHVRLQALCRKVGIDGPTQLAAAIARQEGSATPETASVTGPANWWNGNRRPTVDNLEAIIRVTGGSSDWLLFGLGDMFATEPGIKEKAFDRVAAVVDEVRESGVETGAARGKALLRTQKALTESRKRPTTGSSGQSSRGGRPRER